MFLHFWPRLTDKTESNTHQVSETFRLFLTGHSLVSRLMIGSFAKALLLKGSAIHFHISQITLRRYFCQQRTTDSLFILLPYWWPAMRSLKSEAWRREGLLRHLQSLRSFRQTLGHLFFQNIWDPLRVSVRILFSPLLCSGGERGMGLRHRFAEQTL